MPSHLHISGAEVGEDYRGAAGSCCLDSWFWEAQLSVLNAPFFRIAIQSHLIVKLQWAPMSFYRSTPPPLITCFKILKRQESRKRKETILHLPASQNESLLVHKHTCTLVPSTPPPLAAAGTVLDQNCSLQMSDGSLWSQASVLDKAKGFHLPLSFQVSVKVIE